MNLMVVLISSHILMKVIFSSRFDFFGIYVVMFLEILKTLLSVMVVFSVLIVAFGMAFYILLCQEVN